MPPNRPPTICPSTSTYQRSSHWTVFCEISYWGYFEKIQILWKSGKNVGHFAWKPKCVLFKVCKSLHHRTIQINNQPDATIFQLIILTFIYSSTRFGRFPAHHQELNDSSGSPTTNTARLSPRYEGKTKCCHCSHWGPNDGRENAWNVLSCKQTSG